MGCKSRIDTGKVSGPISQLLRRYLSNIPGKLEIKELQKTATLGTAHMLRKVLVLKYETLNM